MSKLRQYLAAPVVLYALIALLPFERIPSIPVGGLHLRPSLIVALVLVAVVMTQNARVILPRRPLKWAAYAFLGVCLVSSTLSAQPGRAFRTTAYLVLSVLLAICVASAVRQAKLVTIKKVLIVSSLLVCAFGAYQFVADLAGLPGSITGIRPAYSSQVFGFPRVQAASLEPLYFANYLLLPICVLGAIGIAEGESLWILTSLMTALLLTLSRGGVAAGAIAAVALTTTALIKHRWSAAVKLVSAAVIGLILTYAGLYYLVPILHHQSGTKASTAVYSDQVTNYQLGDANDARAPTRHLAIDDFRLHPVVGSGPGTFGYYAHAHLPIYPTQQIVNNEPLELLAETGILGLLAFGLFALLLGIQAVNYLRLPGQPEVRRLAVLGLLLYLIVTAIQYWSFSTLYIIQIWVAIGLLWGLSLTSGKAGKLQS